MLDTLRKLLSTGLRLMAAPPLPESLTMTSSHPGTSLRLRSRRHPYHEPQLPPSSAVLHLRSSTPATRTFPVPRPLYQRQIQPSRGLQPAVSLHLLLCGNLPRPAAPRRSTSLVPKRCKSWASRRSLGISLTLTRRRRRPRRKQSVSPSWVTTLKPKKSRPQRAVPLHLLPPLFPQLPLAQLPARIHDKSQMLKWSD